ncbi:MAG: hypothetical protein C7B44_01565 [Sulfobacillus thermosulfidooxidans]|nr:MAG: hypothetical protein C7B44_01565 [Sulfobacillus thermosulfidooxidans]
MDNGGSNPIETRKLANTHNAIPVIRRWPELNEDINDTTMVFVQCDLKQQSVAEDVRLTRTIATISVKPL